MEQFLKFKEAINLVDWQNSDADRRVKILRESPASNTKPVKLPEALANKGIKKAFGPYKVKKKYNEFPYPTRTNGISKYIFWPLVNLNGGDEINETS